MLDLCYFARNKSNIVEPIFTRSWGRWITSCNRKVKLLDFWFLNSFWGVIEVRKGHFRFLLSFTNATWRQNGCTYWKIKLCDSDRIISLSNAENSTKICQGAAEILWCILRSDVHIYAYTWAELAESCSGIPRLFYVRNGESGKARMSINYANISTEVLDSKHCHWAILIV